VAETADMASTEDFAGKNETFVAEWLTQEGYVYVDFKVTSF